ncbi:N-acetylglucosamine-binding protein GbpA [Aliivibrio finisterrensis]|uniref:N-acetylglucosamine-binding protein GbpA n=1 Tax=Aliivibrio finisterrensis TaxID=511998 RepID=UPI0010224D60|nr:N-acetylglucosamine-binding protein GbpA [Aliivibrio finisterrensis]RYU70359.1 N-acetylglucosamine-binding protein GbpA [Aliivibrio finisterrensis]RYU74221.1 N-acetylglucosamine-binding protein GbpA [Aliivibrio finisterrensis]RYU76826.1 N-acetylglucosamine-binding protein GbpA [Aliivibrio finisterrensis]
MNNCSTKTILALSLMATSVGVSAHGYVSETNGGIAGSRAALCKFPTSDTQEKNTNCGSVQWEPQSVEGPEGFPENGPADGQIAGAGLVQFSELNEQTSDRWVKRPMTAGAQTFEWTFTANHVTRTWKYYMTKQNWNQNAVLTRDSFDLTPFCELEYNMEKPPLYPQTFSHECVVPEREGYQVILAVWDVGDTAAAFYNVIDVKFEGDAGVVDPTWTQGGQINPTRDLNVGDRVFTRVFDASGENSRLSTSVTIENATQGQANNWTHALATKINQEQANIAAGQLNEKGEFVPAFGSNPVYLKAGSGLKSVEIGYQIETPEPSYELDIQGLASMYTIGDTATELDLNLYAVGDMNVELTVYNHAKEALSNAVVDLKDGDVKSVLMALSKSEKGHHMLVSRIKNTEGELIEQTTSDFHLMEEQTPPPAGDYDFVFPENVKNYTAGTKVLAEDGAIYQCKPFPYSGYCVQWTETATSFAPGVGSDWSMAWDKVK